MRTVDLAGCPVGAADEREWIEVLARAAAGDRPHHHVSLNAAKWVAMARDPELRDAVRRAGSVAADGVGIVLASRFLGDPLPARVTGYALATALVARAPAEGWRIFLLGAMPPVVAEVAARLRARGVAVVGARDGYFDRDEPVVDEIRAACPHLLLLALGTPRAERFAARWAAQLGVPLILGVGGTFDVWAGASRGAPEWVGRAGLEWAWRLAHDPRRRFRRAVVDSAAFAWAIARGRRLPGGPA